MKTTNHTLCRFVIRIPKKDAVFTYFTLEANEGLCFHSTLDYSLKEPFRDILLVGTQDYKESILHVLHSLQNEIALEIIEEKEFLDGKDLNLTAQYHLN